MSDNDPLWKKFLPKPKLSNYLSNEIEVGYSQYGPTLALSGTLSTASSVIFVYDISIDLIHNKQKKSHQFGWFAFRPHKFTIGGFQGIDLKMASKFMITPSEPYQYNILFSDQGTYTEINPILKKIKLEWGKLVDNNKQLSQKSDYKNIFDSFIKDYTITEAINNLHDMSYWEEGDYIIMVVVTTKNPKNTYEFKRSFHLTFDDVNSLQSNAYAIVADICRQPASYIFASPKLS